MENDRNRNAWNRESDQYQATHGRRLEETAEAWGVWRIPESRLQVLGDVGGRDVLELGCGAAPWSAALAARGARVVGIDISERQLFHASQARGRASRKFGLVHGDAVALPFAGTTFDIVFCDHGAMTFASPDATVPEAARVLRTGGLLAFCMSTPIRDMCWETSTNDSVLRDVYYSLDAIEDGDAVVYQRPYGDWIRLFRANGLDVEDLIELRAPEGASTTYASYASAEWARRWPAEHIWKARKK